MTTKTWKILSNPLALLAFGLLLLALVGCSASSGEPVTGAERSALLVNVDSARAAGEYTIRREYFGRVEATRYSELGFELAGELERLGVDEGDVVAKGQLLAALDSARLEARRAEAEAAVMQAASARDVARRSYERYREAARSGGISEQQVDLALDAANAASAGLAAAQARLASVEVDLRKSRLVAPYEAVVVRRLADEGNIVAAGQAVLHLQEAAAPELRVGVASDLADAMAPGDAQTVVIDGRDVQATVRAVLPRREPSTRTVDVLLQLDDVYAAIPGDLARLVAEETVEEAGYWLPAGSLAEGSRGLWTAYVVRPLEPGAIAGNGASHYVEPRPIEIVYRDGDQVFVRGSLASGDRIVTGGLQRIVPYQQVRIDGMVALGDSARNES